MGFEAQHIKAPDGTPMVVLKASDYEDLLVLAEEGGDRVAALAALDRIAAGEGTVPDAVLALMLDEGLSALAAWRRFRGLSQAELARRSGVSQVWIGRIESGGGAGSNAVRSKLALALDAPAWALQLDDDGSSAAKEKARAMPKGSKYAPLADWLAANGEMKVTMSFDAIAKLVGGLPASAFEHMPWWQNNRGHGQALGWRSAGYIVKADLVSKTAIFMREG
jgi:transcriptional regulator with XRE-family HTH domain